MQLRSAALTRYLSLFILTVGICFLTSLVRTDFATLASNQGNVVVYQTNFNKLAPGITQPYPGATDQDGWYRELALGDAFGEIQETIALDGQALHEHTASTVPPYLQTIDRRNLNPIPLGPNAVISLKVDFYAHSNNLTAVNNYLAAFEVTGGPHPGFRIIGFDVGAGNGLAKSLTGVNVRLATFNGTNNNGPIPLTVGQGLAWDTWHSVTVVLDHADDTYISITVDEQKQDLTGYRPPRSFDGTQWLRGQRIENLHAILIPDDVGGDRTDDDVYWDNLRVRVIPRR